MSLSWGKPKRLVPKGNKLEQASIQRTTLRWESVVSYNNIAQPVINYVGTQPTSGQAMFLPNYNTVNSGGGPVYAPLHLYDLTSTINDTSQGLLEAIPGYQLAFEYDAGLITAPKWFPLNGTDYAGNLKTLAPWVVEEAPGNLSQNSTVYPGARCLMPWVQIKLNCAGAATLATTYEVSLVQFTEDYIDPEFNLAGTTQTIGASGATENYAATALNVWQQQVSKEMLHPIAAMASRQSRKYIKVLYKTRFTIQPRLTIEPDSPLVGHSKLVNIMWHANRICKYDTHQTGTFNVNGLVAGEYSRDIGQVSSFVQPRAKVYLMVKATSLTQLSTGTMTPYVTPSYDVVIRKQQVTLH